MVDHPFDEQVADALGNWLAESLIGASSVGDKATFKSSESQSGFGEEILARDRLLAAALGACVCWGRRIDCESCAGLGAPGWRVPDRELFGEYVAPAVIAVADGCSAADLKQSVSYVDRKGDGDV